MTVEISLLIDENDGKEDTIKVKRASEHFKKYMSAIFYGLASFTLTIINKNILTVYNFPSVQFLGLGQMLSTIVLLYVAKKFKWIHFPDLTRNTFVHIWPLPLLYMGDIIFGLAGTKELSLPMFTALRRFLILFTMIGEFCILREKPTVMVQISVSTMITGAAIAVYDDLAFTIHGYICIFLNNFCSAMNAVYIKQKLVSNDELGKYGLMFYNSLFMFLPAVIIAKSSGELDMQFRFLYWNDIMFLVQFLLSCVMGSVFTYSMILCTNYNSALTTCVIGCLKNVCVTYVGMFIANDYIFSVINFIGINISVLGSFMYLASS